MRSLSVIGILVVTSACASPTAPESPVDARVVLALGEIAAVNGASSRIRFLEVVGDSRCPADAFCIQGGMPSSAST